MQTQATQARKQEHLDRAATLAYDAISEAGAIEAFGVQNQISDILRELGKAGAKSPFKNKPVAPEADLAQLAVLDTPEVRELLAALAQVQVLAERVDAQRGRCLPEDMPLQPGESRGTDYAETISNLAQRLRVEIHGPAGRE